MPALDDLKRLLLRHFFLVLVIGVVVVTALLQAPRLMNLGRLGDRAGQVSQELKTLQAQGGPSPAEIAATKAAVPAASLTEPAQFQISIQRLAEGTGCVLAGALDSEPKLVGGSKSLAHVDASVKVTGSYGELRRFLQLVRMQKRTLAVTAASISPADWPDLAADFTVRRYVLYTGPAENTSGSQAGGATLDTDLNAISQPKVIDDTAP